MSSSFAKFSVSTPPPASNSPPLPSSTVRRSTIQGEDVNRSSVKRGGPLRRTSMLASLPSANQPNTAPVNQEDIIHEDDDLND